MRKHIVYSLFLLCTGLEALSQSASWEKAGKEEVVAAYQKVCNWMTSTTSYAFRMTYTSYKDHASTEIAESTKGYFQRSGTRYKSEAAGVKTVQNTRCRMIIDSANKVISLTEPSNLSPAMPSTEDLVTLLQNVKALKKKQNGAGCTYRVEFNKNTQYEAYEFSVNAQGLLQKAVYYYSEQRYKDYGETEDEDPIELKIKPRMEILFENYEVPYKAGDTHFSEKGISFQEQGKVTVSGPYQSYKVRDYRIQAKK